MNGTRYVSCNPIHSHISPNFLKFMRKKNQKFFVAFKIRYDWYDVTRSVNEVKCFASLNLSNIEWSKAQLVAVKLNAKNELISVQIGTNLR